MVISPLTKDREKVYFSMSRVSYNYGNKIKYGEDIGIVDMTYEDDSYFRGRCARINKTIEKIELCKMDESEGRETVTRLFDEIKILIKMYKNKSNKDDKVEEKLYHKMFCLLNFPYVLLNKYRPGLIKVMNKLVKDIESRRTSENLAAMKNNFLVEIDRIRSIEKSKNISLFSEDDIFIAASILRMYDDGLIENNKQHNTSFFTRLVVNEIGQNVDTMKVRVVVTKLLGFGFIKGKNKGGNMFFIGD